MGSSPQNCTDQMARVVSLFVLLLSASVVSAYTLTGCFQDGPKRALLSTRLALPSALTPKACSDAARARGLPVYGLARGNECWIGMLAVCCQPHHNTAALAVLDLESSTHAHHCCRCRAPPCDPMCAGADLKASRMVYPASTECNTPCVGDAAQTCGGANSVSLVRARVHGLMVSCGRRQADNPI